ncbi:hypothetical protein ELI55_02365 [Rhizobium ruizarguesonis]|uniref:alginate O-acetyltransferase AlgX-related protein n=1 Tax=Rhizobium ruizarguesonis TaxID=2081791 RepID=UPI0010315B0B|nr:hypothetical protein [Rhizobium ruizarguesonis]TAU03834.1 hypothetical protein ELI55_02365 [Rhizobium ruizarguesonis]
MLKNFRMLFPIAFLAAVTLNATLTISGWRAPGGVDENRNMAVFPEWSGSVTPYIRSIDAWLTDNFAFRKPLVEAFNSYLYEHFRSTLARNVVVGEGPWVFGADFDGQTTIAPRTLKPDYLERAKSALTERRDWLAARGIHMIVMFMPSKATIYGNRYLPWYWHFDEKTPTQSEQVYADLGTEFQQNVVPLRQAMLAASKDTELYYRTDTHATQYGTFIAYEQLAKHIETYFPEDAPSPYPDYDLLTDVLRPTAFGRLMGLPFQDFSLVPAPKGGAHFVGAEAPPAAALLPKGARLTFTANASVRNVRAVLIGDSFTNRMSNIFGEVFRESATLNMNNVSNERGDKFPAAFLDAYRPDFVVFMYVDSRIVECRLECGEFPVTNPDGVAQAGKAARSIRSASR